MMKTKQNNNMKMGKGDAWLAEQLTGEICLLCYQQLVNKGAIVSKFCSFELKFPTAMFQQNNCLCTSQKRNL